MTVESQIIKARYEGNGVGREFPTQFAFLEDAHVRAVLRSPAPGAPAGVQDALLELGRDYTLRGAGDPGGGTLEMAAPPAPGQTLTLYSDVPLTQERAWNNMDVIDTAEIEKAHDKLTRISLQLKEELGRCVKYAVADPEPGRAVEPAALLAARDTALAARDGALASEGAALAAAQRADEASVLAAAATLRAETAAQGAQADATRAEAAGHKAEQHAALAFAAAAPAWDAATAYDFPAVVAWSDGHSYRAVAPSQGQEPPGSPAWVRVTVGRGHLFEQDPDGDIIPAL
ncbi:hypothetical protein [Desulfocurvus vexinensis]|uniref:hypothetical protein n=1 Tax=Desulfocurvus vexinensis TaxID=399548 RepID=UPI0004AD5D54|nr:hypothetical protein [Desulfocurvus vexinensis]